MIIHFIPELNYWIIRLLHNAAVYDTHHRLPAKMSDEWREPNSIFELLLNENFNPDNPIEPSPSTSSSPDYTSEREYIYEYRQVNHLRLTDDYVINRIRPYWWYCKVFAANSEKFDDAFNMTGGIPDIRTQQASGDAPYLPYDVPEDERSPYITYKYDMYFSTNYNLPVIDPDFVVDEEYPQTPVVTIPSDNIFDLEEHDFIMLDLLYDYKMGYDVQLECIDFDNISKTLAKLIYIYLDAMINDNFEYYDGEDPISDELTGDSAYKLLCCSYEKHIINILYILKQKSYGVVWKEYDVISDRKYNTNVDNFMLQKKIKTRHILTQTEIDNSKIDITSSNLPWNRRDITVFHDGVVLEQDVHYKGEIDFSDPSDVKSYINIMSDGLSLLDAGDQLLFIWSYVDPYSAYSQTDE